LLDQLIWLHEAFKRCEEFGKKTLPEELKAKLPDLMRMLARYAHLVLNMPMMFTHPETSECCMEEGN